MFTIGNDELEEAPSLGETISCHHCGQIHKIVYGKTTLPDGSQEESKMLAFYKCGKKTYLAGIDGKDIRKKTARKK